MGRRDLFCCCGVLGFARVRVHGGLWLMPPSYSRSGIAPPTKRSPDWTSVLTEGFRQLTFLSSKLQEDALFSSHGHKSLMATDGFHEDLHATDVACRLGCDICRPVQNSACIACHPQPYGLSHRPRMASKSANQLSNLENRPIS
jgi:hypothetical protein